MAKRGLAIVFTLIGIAIVLSIAGFATLYMLFGRAPAVPSRAMLVLEVGGDLTENAPTDVVSYLRGTRTPTVNSVIQLLHKAKADRRVAAVLLKPTGFSSPYWAKVQEIRDALIDFRSSGKPVYAYLEYADDRNYYLATAAERIFLMPSATLDLSGVATYALFLRGTFDKIGAYPDFVHIGDFKTAPNQYTQKGFTPAHREMAQSLNRDMYEQLVAGVAEGRKKSEDEVRTLFDRGPFIAAKALEAGLVDELAYEDELDDRVPELGGDSDRRIEGSDYQRISFESAGVRRRSRIAVLYIVGTIASGKGGFDPVNGSIAGSESIVEQIRKIRDDNSIKAIVLRIDSPGGSSVASDVIWRELAITRLDNPSRPIVTSMSDLAASGGYYIAIPADAIVAQPGTLTGSIGIFGGKIVIGGTLGKAGIGTETVTSGANADMYSPFTPFTAPQRAKVEEFMQDFYKGFVGKVAESRKTTPEAIHAVAQGRVWTGRQALAHGLVDRLGGLDTAVSLAKERAKIPADEDVQLVVYPERRNFFDALSEQFGGAGSAGMWSMLAGTSERRAVAALSAPTRLFRRGEPLALMPFTFVR